MGFPGMMLPALALCLTACTRDQAEARNAKGNVKQAAPSAAGRGPTTMVMATNPYQDLADAVLSACPPGYGRIHLEAELGEISAAITLKCRNAAGDEVRSDMPGDSALRAHLALQSIREGMARQSGATWRSCIFTIDEHGRFNLQVRYDDDPPRS